MLAGDVLVESDGAVILVALDRAGSGSTADGFTDHLVSFRAGEPIAPSLSFRGEALVDFARRSVRVTPLTGGPGWTFSIDPAVEGPAAPSAEGTVPLAGGRALIVRSADFGASLEQVVADAWKEERAIRRIVGYSPPEEHKDEGGGGSGGCAASCQIECQGGGGSCSASCPSTMTCAECGCDGATNVASCSCRMKS